MRILNVCGARPNFMKIAPLMEAYRRHPSVQPLLVHTGQHYDAGMSEQFFDELGLPRPDVNLGVGSGSPTWQTAEIMLRFEPVVAEHRPWR
jgi:UDP-N-acetylglucosamine 2-epimerase (non-hydrolysing)